MPRLSQPPPLPPPLLRSGTPWRAPAVTRCCRFGGWGGRRPRESAGGWLGRRRCRRSLLAAPGWKSLDEELLNSLAEEAELEGSSSLLEAEAEGASSLVEAKAVMASCLPGADHARGTVAAAAVDHDRATA